MLAAGCRLKGGDHGLPLLGNMWSFIRAFRSENPDTLIDNLITRYGRTGICKTHLDGNPSIVVCGPETCRKVLLDDDKFGTCYTGGTVELPGKTSLAAIPAPEYTRVRKLIAAPIIGSEALSMYTRYIEDCVSSSLDESTSMSQPIKFFEEVNRVFYMILANIFLGSGAETLPEYARKYYSDAHDELISMAINIPGFSYKALREEQEEILRRRRIGQKGLNLKEIRQMEYLSKVIDGTLRIINLLFANFRVAKVYTNMNGYFLPKGWKFLVWNREVHLDPENFENPKHFLPSRWDNHQSEPVAFTPFGVGIRICPGAVLAKLQMSIFFHYFLLNYKLETS